jgi:hypothetical protein
VEKLSVKSENCKLFLWKKLHGVRGMGCGMRVARCAVRGPRYTVRVQVRYNARRVTRNTKRAPRRLQSKRLLFPLAYDVILKT